MAPTGEPQKSGDELVVFVLSHPIRVDALRIFNGREASVAEVARELRENAKKVGNHVKVLLELGCIEWTRTEKKRGADEHFYRSVLTRVSAEEWKHSKPAERLRITSLGFLAVVAEGLAAIRAGELDEPFNCYVRIAATKSDEK